MELRATTTGTGPFKPAIIWDSVEWVMHKEFDSEDKAIEYVNKVLVQVGDAVNEALTNELFEPLKQK